MGIKTGEKKERDGERERCATINHLLGVQVYLASFFLFFFEIHSTQERERGWGMGRKRGRQREKTAWVERGRGERRWRVIYRGVGGLPGSDRMRREAEGMEWRAEK